MMNCRFSGTPVTGTIYSVYGDELGISKLSIPCAIHSASEILVGRMPDLVNFPSPVTECAGIDVYEECQLPNIIEAINGTPLNRPRNAFTWTDKGYYFLNLQFIFDVNDSESLLRFWVSFLTAAILLWTQMFPEVGDCQERIPSDARKFMCCWISITLDEFTRVQRKSTYFEHLWTSWPTLTNESSCPWAKWWTRMVSKN